MKGTGVILAPSGAHRAVSPPGSPLGSRAPAPLGKGAALLGSMGRYKVGDKKGSQMPRRQPKVTERDLSGRDGRFKT